MKLSVLLVFLAVAAASALQQAPSDAAEHDVDEPQQPRSRPARWVVFKPMFAVRAKQQQLNRAMHRQELRRQWRAKGRRTRTRRALHFPAGGGGSGEESGLALRVAVNDLLFQSAPANDLPEPAARHAGFGSAGMGAVGTGLKPMLLARLRSASHEREPAAAEEEEAFLLMSTAGGRPAIVPAPTSRPLPPARRPHKKQAHNKPHKSRKGEKQRRRVARDTSATSSASSASIAALLGQRLDAVEGAMRQRGDGIAERVKQYDAQGTYPAYSYTHGRYTRAATPAVSVMKVKVQGEVDDDDEEAMEVAENIVFRPLFAHRDLQATRQERRRSGLAKKPTKPAFKPLRRRQPVQPHRQAAATPASRPAAATTWFHRRTYLKHAAVPAGRRYQYQYSPYRRIVVYQ